MSSHHAAAHQPVSSPVTKHYETTDNKADQFQSVCHCFLNSIYPIRRYSTTVPRVKADLSLVLLLRIPKITFLRYVIKKDALNVLEGLC